MDVQTSSNTVVVGPAELLSVDRIAAENAVWFTPSPVTAVDTEPDDAWHDAELQIRAHAAPVPVRVRATPGTPARDGSVAGDGVPGLELRLVGAPLRGVAAGQSAVVYRGTQVLGQATVADAWRA